MLKIESILLIFLSDFKRNNLQRPIKGWLRSTWYNILKRPPLLGTVTFIRTHLIIKLLTMKCFQICITKHKLFNN